MGEKLSVRKKMEELYSEENLDRSSPVLWPEVIPGVEKFTDSFTGEEQKPSDSQEKILEKRIADLKQLNEKQLLAEIKALKERAYRIGLEEAKEVERGKMLNIFGDFSRDELVSLLPVYSSVNI